LLMKQLRRRLGSIMIILRPPDGTCPYGSGVLSPATGDEERCLIESQVMKIRHIVTISCTAVAACALSAGAAPALGASQKGTGSRLPDGTVSVISTTSNRVDATVRVGPDPVDVAVVPDQSTAYVLGFGYRQYVDRVTIQSGVARSSRISAGPNVDGMALAPGGRYLYIVRQPYEGRTGAVLGSIMQVRASTGATTRVFHLTRFGGGSPVVVSPGGQTVYFANTVGRSDAIDRLQVGSGHEERAIVFGSYQDQIWQLLVSANGRRLYALTASSKGGWLTSINAVTGRVVGSARIPGMPMDMAITPNGRLVFVTSNFSDVTAVQTASMKVIRRVSVNFAYAVAITPDGRTAYVSGSSSQAPGAAEVTPIPVTTNVEHAPLPVGQDSANDMAIAPDGKVIYIICGNDTVVPLNLLTNTVGTPIGVGPDAGGDYDGFPLLAFTTDSRTLFLVNANN
jgi:DNA-binding beta-propeller fold protein YncE